MGENPSRFSMETAGKFSSEIPMGYRFLPTDEELVTYYLRNRVFLRPLPPIPIEDIDASQFYSNSPDSLVISFERKREYFFFIKDDNGGGGNIREIEDGRGFWKSSGDENPIYDRDGNIFAFKIYWRYFTQSAKTKRARKTHWRMEIYRLPIHCYKEQKLVLGRVKRNIYG